MRDGGRLLFVREGPVLSQAADCKTEQDGEKEQKEDLQHMEGPIFRLCR